MRADGISRLVWEQHKTGQESYLEGGAVHRVLIRIKLPDLQAT